MAIIVNKEEKRKNIALSCRSLLLEHGINDLTIAQIAKAAGIGKGTVYEYFQNKEDIVFEIITLFIAEHEEEFYKKVTQAESTKEKIYHFLNLLYVNEETKKHLSLYREFIAFSLIDGTEEMEQFSQACQNKFSAILETIFDEAIQNHEIVPAARDLIPALHLFSKGLVIDTHILHTDAKSEISRFIETLFTLIEIKEKK
ncbi:TetR/AcrR family transcriptional regulator [Sulfurovum sp. zt1-1]|uniref:TetR/AcrR family transcriptional regulator n=1 Tax=Sulfurovum zhangzhouensis TaxID=3019067 RepID=A0ABT7QVQ1_9BACT|nr:TetR/AcrR family transcriptional regulator [Sulfurovum zhangzhouensis]MDM5270920.1 TetR/AcrR family transcriptional regulator [Sulfurovum zhangzhouensis]